MLLSLLMNVLGVCSNHKMEVVDEQKQKRARENEERRLHAWRVLYGLDASTPHSRLAEKMAERLKEAVHQRQMADHAKALEKHNKAMYALLVL